MPKAKAKTPTAQDVPASPLPDRASVSGDPAAQTDPPDEKSRDERVREAAYRRYQARGGQHGGHEQDWLEAEAEVRPPEGN